MTYGGNGQVLSNWTQFRLIMHYLSVMEEDQTLVLYSGHPMGLFPSHLQAPRCVISNGMVSAWLITTTTTSSVCFVVIVLRQSSCMYPL